MMQSELPHLNKYSAASFRPEIPLCKKGKLINPIHKQLPLDPQEFENNFEPNYNNMVLFNYSSRFENSSESGQNALAYEEGHVPDFLCNITADQLKHLAPSVLQIRAMPRATMLRLSPSYGVMSLTSTLMLLMANNWPKQYATLSSFGPDADKDTNKQIKFEYDFYYNYEHLKDFTSYKERDIHHLAMDCDNKHNDLAFVIFNDPSISAKQSFFIPTSKTWQLHNSDAFIFAYPSHNSIDEQCRKAFPDEKKVLMPGTVKFKPSDDDGINLTPNSPPIIGVHTCGAVDGMEGGAIVLTENPHELIGIHVSGVRHLEFKYEKGVDYNFFVSVHHPRFVQYYVEKIIPDLLKNSKEFLLTNRDKIDAYLHVHGYQLNDMIPRDVKKLHNVIPRRYSMHHVPHTRQNANYKPKRVILKPFN